MNVNFLAKCTNASKLLGSVGANVLVNRLLSSVISISSLARLGLPSILSDAALNALRIRGEYLIFASWFDMRFPAVTKLCNASFE